MKNLRNQRENENNGQERQSEDDEHMDTSEEDYNNYVASSTGASAGATNIVGSNSIRGSHENAAQRFASGSGSSEEWAFRDNKDIKAEEVRVG